MRICFASHRDPTRDPRSRALLVSLVEAGHDVTIAAPSAADPVPGTTLRTSTGQRSGVVGRLVRRFQTPEKVARRRALQLRHHVADSQPDLVYPHRLQDADLVEAVAAPVVRPPDWTLPESLEHRDWIAVAPHSAATFAGRPSPTTHPPDGIGALDPSRHQGVEVAIAYRATSTNPGRYLEAALRRSGADVTRHDGHLDWSRISANAVVVIVESPYPALKVTGSNPGATVMFWVHHGEHHLPTNLRLVDRYAADAVLLAHSWHLAHRFPIPVYRFPFGVAPELVPDTTHPWNRRTYDVAMVGAGFESQGARYERRRVIHDALRSEFPDTSSFIHGVSPETMVATYGDSRVVVNDGGTKHLPITMRVFEAISAGALLITEDLPGTDTLFEPGRHYVPMEDDIAAQVRSLISDPASPSIADAARLHALARHTYDHRVDQLLSVAREMRTQDRHPRPSTPARSRSQLGRLIEIDVDAQDLALFGVTEPTGLDDRVLRHGPDRPIRAASIDAAVIGSGWDGDLSEAINAARAYLYAEGPRTEEVAAAVNRIHPTAHITIDGGLLRADLGGTGYGRRTQPSSRDQAT